jgi:hypothetical protein
MTEQPEPPGGLRVSYPDGHVEPMDCTYMGRDKFGLHQWICYLPSAANGLLVDVLMDTLPPYTELTIRGPR